MFCAACGEEVLPTIRICPSCGGREFSASPKAEPVAPVPAPLFPPVAPVPAPLFPPAPPARPPAPVSRPVLLALAGTGAVAVLALFLVGAAFLWWRGSGTRGKPGLAIDLEDPFRVTLLSTMTFGEAEASWPFAPIDLAISVDGVEQKRWSVTADETGSASFDLHDLWNDAGSPSQASLRATTSWEGKPVAAERALSREEIDASIARRLDSTPTVDDYRLALRWRPDDRALWKGLAELSESVDAMFAWREWLLIPAGDAASDEDARRAVREKVVALARALDSRPGGTADAIALLEQAEQAASDEDFLHAYHLAVAAEDAAPWWREPYERAGSIALISWNRMADGGVEELPDIDGWDLEQATALGSETADALLQQARDKKTKIEAARAAEAELERAFNESGQN